MCPNSLLGKTRRFDMRERLKSMLHVTNVNHEELDTCEHIKLHNVFLRRSFHDQMFNSICSMLAQILTLQHTPSDSK
jgi:hypothetical protein